ncbi:MAG: Sun protein, partial [Proteobacteria bacterium]|nr:Sun protein [Pseudomonadota bacterium]
MSDARAIASRILTRITRERAFAAALIEAETNRLTDPRDAALCHELVLGVLRHRPWLDALLQRVSRRGTLNVDPQVHDILRVAAYQLAFLDRIPAHAAVKTAVDQVRHTPAARLASLTNALHPAR